MLTHAGKTTTGRPYYSLTVTGPVAAMIERATHASFYGINGMQPDCIKARWAAYEEISACLNDNDIDWKSSYIFSARMIDTTGTRILYKAEILFEYD